MTTGPFSLGASCERQAKELAYDGIDGKVSYDELLEHVKLRATSLSSMGIESGDRVVWCPKNDFDTIVAFWSLFALGGVACPISPRFPLEKQKEIANRLGAKWLPTGSLGRTAHRQEPNPPDVNAPATIIHSSGSTGEPKAIVHSLAAHLSSAAGASENMPLGVGDRWLWSLPTYHVSGLSILFRCALGGATICGMSESQELNSTLLADTKTTHVSLVTTQLRRLLKDDRFPPETLRAVLLGGSAMPVGLIRQARYRGVPVYTTYGLTEMASQVATSSCDSTSVTAGGRVLKHCELRIHESGEILVRGTALCLGYERSGRIQPIVGQDGWFHTGDLGRLAADGELFVAGRMDNMFISGGENIFPETVERALLELPGISQAIVVPRSDEEFGSRPIAFVDGCLDHRGEWIVALQECLREFELPIEFLAWPTEAQNDMKPSRAKLYAIANRK